MGGSPPLALQQLIVLSLAPPAMAPAMKAAKKTMAAGTVVKTIAEKTGLKSKDVKGIFSELQTFAYDEVKKTEKFVIPQLVMLKLRHKPATKAGVKTMFGKEVKVATKPAKNVVKAFPAKALKDSI